MQRGEVEWTRLPGRRWLATVWQPEERERERGTLDRLAALCTALQPAAIVPAHFIGPNWDDSLAGDLLGKDMF